MNFFIIKAQLGGLGRNFLPCVINFFFTSILISLVVVYTSANGDNRNHFFFVKGGGVGSVFIGAQLSGEISII